MRVIKTQEGRECGSLSNFADWYQFIQDIEYFKRKNYLNDNFRKLKR